MKYLNKFENHHFNRTGEEDLGVSLDDIKYLFTDLSDNGWSVDVRFMQKLHQFKDVPVDKEFPVGLIYYIQVSISKPTPYEQRFNRSSWNEVQELNKLADSEEYKELIDIVSLRLDDLGLYIKKQERPHKQLNILIYRKVDKNYIK